MKASTLAIALLCLGSVCLVAAAADLKIDVTHKPDECDRKAKSGDTIHVHYTYVLRLLVRSLAHMLL